MSWLLPLVGVVHVAFGANLLEETRGVVGRGIGEVDPLAEQLVDEGRWDEATVVWKQGALAGSVESGLWAIVSALRAENEDAAQEATIIALETSGGDPRVLLAAAWLLNEAGAHKEAYRLLKKYPIDAPDAEGALVLRLRALMLDQRVRKSLRLRRKALRDGQRVDAWFWFELGLEDSWRNKPEATAHMRRALSARNVSGLHYHLLMLHLAEQGEIAEAVEVGVQGMARFPDEPAVGFGLIGLCQEPEARAALEAIVIDQPNRPIPHAVLGTLLFAEEQSAQAAVHLQAAVDNGEDRPSMYRMLAEAHVASDHQQAAWTTLSGGVGKHPDDLRLWRDLFALGQEQQRLGDALRLSEAAWTRGLRHAFLVDISYQAANDLDDLDVALTWSDRSVGLDGRRWQGLLQRALTLSRLGRGQEALAAYEEALQLEPEEPQLLNNLAWFLLEPSGDVTPDPDRALHLAEEAVANAEAPVPAYLDTLARALWELGDQDRARELQRQAAELDPANEHIRNTLQRYETNE
ncbi:MAG: hypothetical protein AAFV53_12895 [Myxococcota bacterium]